MLGVIYYSKKSSFFFFTQTLKFSLLESKHLRVELQQRKFKFNFIEQTIPEG